MAHVVLANVARKFTNARRDLHGFMLVARVAIRSRKRVDARFHLLTLSLLIVPAFRAARYCSTESAHGSCIFLKAKFEWRIDGLAERQLPLSSLLRTTKVTVKTSSESPARYQRIGSIDLSGAGRSHSANAPALAGVGVNGFTYAWNHVQPGNHFSFHFQVERNALGWFPRRDRDDRAYRRQLTEKRTSIEERRVRVPLFVACYLYQILASVALNHSSCLRTRKLSIRSPNSSAMTET